MNRSSLLLILLVSPLIAQSLDIDYGSHLTDTLLLIHPLANYEFSPLWRMAWEDDLFSGNSVRSNFGSVTLTELLSDFRITVNQNLVGKLWFHYTDHRYQSHHIDSEISSRFIGLEQYLWKGLSVFCYGDLAFDKEDADIQCGLAYSDSTRRRYIRAAFLDEDEFYDDKNDRGGITIRRPYGFLWSINQSIGECRLFSEGRYSQGFDRMFPDENRSPDIHAHESTVRWMNARLYIPLRETTIMECSAFTWDFYDSKTYRLDDLIYEYSHDMWWLNLTVLHYLTPELLMRTGSYFARHDAISTGDRFLLCERTETLPYCFVEWERSFGTIEIGYMGSFHEWQYEDDSGVETGRGYVDKIKVGYGYAFSKSAWIGLSISHVLAIEEFGGGNAQFLLMF